MKRTGDPLWDVAFDTWKRSERLEGIYLATTHTREMMCEVLRKMDRQTTSDQANRVRRKKIAGRKAYEKPVSWIRDENGRKVREGFRRG